LLLFFSTAPLSTNRNGRRSYLTPRRPVDGVRPLRAGAGGRGAANLLVFDFKLKLDGCCFNERRRVLVLHRRGHARRRAAWPRRGRHGRVQKSGERRAGAWFEGWRERETGEREEREMASDGCRPSTFLQCPSSLSSFPSPFQIQPSHNRSTRRRWMERSVAGPGRRGNAWKSSKSACR
jgi:hypothetical protein